MNVNYVRDDARNSTQKTGNEKLFTKGATVVFGDIKNKRTWEMRLAIKNLRKTDDPTGGLSAQ